MSNEDNGDFFDSGEFTTDDAIVDVSHLRSETGHSTKVVDNVQDELEVADCKLDLDHLKMSLECIDIPAILIDREMVVVYATKACSKIGYNPDKIINRKFPYFTKYPQVANKLASVCFTALSAKIRKRMDIRFRRGEKLIWAKCAFHPISALNEEDFVLLTFEIRAEQPASEFRPASDEKTTAQWKTKSFDDHFKEISEAGQSCNEDTERLSFMIKDLEKKVQAVLPQQNRLNEKRISAVYFLTKQLMSEPELHRKLKLIVTRTKEILRTNTAYIKMINPDKKEFEMKAQVGLKDPEFKNHSIRTDEGLAGKLYTEFLDGSSDKYQVLPGIIIDDYQNEVKDYDPVAVNKEDLKSGLVTPIIYKGIFFGILYAFSRSGEESLFDNDDLVTLGVLGSLAALEINSYQSKIKHGDTTYKIDQEKHELKSIVDNFLDLSVHAVVIYNEKGHPKYISKSFETLFGWTYQELENKKIPFVPEDETEKNNVKRMIRIVMETNQPIKNERAVRLTKNGRSIPVLINATQLQRIDNSPSGILALYSPIGEDSGKESDISSLSEQNTRLMDQVKDLETDRKRFLARLREHCGEYIADALVNTNMGTQMGGDKKRIANMVVDVRDFTAHTGSLQPDKTVRLLNTLLDRLIGIIERHGGLAAQFTGDGLLAYFGVRDNSNDCESSAVKCAIEMMSEMPNVNDNLQIYGLPALSIACSIASGEVVTGIVGCAKRKFYCAVGDSVIMAFRMEKEAAKGEILITKNIFNRLRPNVICGTERTVEFKNLLGQHTIYRVESYTD